MVKSPIGKIKFSENCTLGIADLLLGYSMLAPVIFLIIGSHIKLEPNIFRTLIVLLGPGFLAGAIYLKSFGIQALKKHKWILICVISFSIVFLLSCFKHIDTESTVNSLKFFISWCLFGFCLGTLSNMSVSRTERFNMILVIFIIGIFTYSIYQWWPTINLQFNLWGINNAQIGTLFYFFSLCVLFCIDVPKNLVSRLLLSALSLACFIVAFYSATRTAFWGFLIALGIYLFFYLRNKLNKIYLIIAACLLIIGLLLLLPKINKLVITKHISAFKNVDKIITYMKSDDPDHREIDYPDSYRSIIIRLRIWKAALEEIKKNPVLGSGIGISYLNYVHPHNIVLELLAETGVVGLGVFVVFFALIFKRAFLFYRKLAIGNRMTFLFYPLSLLFFFLYSFLHTDLSTEYFKWYFAGLITGFDISG